jgi:hypothetical protein
LPHDEGDRKQRESEADADPKREDVRQSQRFPIGLIDRVHLIFTIQPQKALLTTVTLFDRVPDPPGHTPYSNNSAADRGDFVDPVWRSRRTFMEVANR